MPAYIKTANHITITFDDGESTNVYKNNDNFVGVYDAIKNKTWEAARRLAFPVIAAKEQIKDYNGVTIDSGVVYLNDNPLHNTLTTRMVEMFEDGLDIEPLLLFLVNLMGNPSNRSVNELYGFLEQSKLPITEDGHFLAYKVVNDDFTDCHTSTIDNSVGEEVWMERNAVDDDKSRTCSHGLHFCARKYLPAFGSSSRRLVIVKINPRDVVSIPVDYNNSKGRCCRYTVLKELDSFHDETVNSEMPVENLEMAFTDTSDMVPEKNSVTIDMIEQLDILHALATDDEEPKVIRMFDGATSAMHELGIDSSSITKVCDNKRRSAGGYGWRWAHTNPENVLTNA